MRKLFRSLISRKEEARTAAIPNGERVYAIGDIHGRRDLFEALVEAIDADDAEAGAADTTIILLGDLIDRGPDSAGVVAQSRALQQRRQTRILAGNHEEMFLLSYRKVDVLRSFLRHGGRETLLSYGYNRDALIEDGFEQVQQRMIELVPPEDREFIEGFEEKIEIGDYWFVHAGIKPGRAFEEQKRSDLLWIREPFLSYEEPHEAVVVHGHTIKEEPEDRGNRIGIDTGAFYSGRLTALVLEGTKRRYIEAHEQDGAITVEGVTGR